MDLRQPGGEFVIHYGGRLNEVNAYTFANSLVGLANSMRATNAIVNPGFEIEVSIQALGPGSFRAKIRTANKSLRNLFSVQGAGTGVMGALLATYIWETAHPRQAPTIIVNDDSVVFQYGDGTVILPRSAYEPYAASHASKDVKEGIAEAFEQLDRDESIAEFGITPSIDDKQLLLNVPRDNFPIISGTLRDEIETKTADQRASVQVVRAILEPSNRRWEFIWLGNRIAAPVLDKDFYHALARRTDSLATGDILDVTLRVRQRPIGDTGIFENVGYEVLKVHSHTPRPQQD